MTADRAGRDERLQGQPSWHRLGAVERVEMSAFKVNHRGTGSAQSGPF